MKIRSTKDIGALGEDIAVRHLKKLKYKIIARNYLTKRGEVDIIAKDGDTIAFIEVKSRKSGTKVNPLYSVNIRKQKQICKAAQDYIVRKKIKDTMFRFDVLTVMHGGGEPEILLIRDAFEFRGLDG